jgi:hypothetical protein
MRNARVLAPLALLALIHAVVRYIGDPRPIDGLIRPLIAIWFAGLGATYALLWVNNDRGRRLLPIWAIGGSLGFLLDNLGILSPMPPGTLMTALNWVGLGLNIALAVIGFTSPR